MGVADIVSGGRTFAANFTLTGHDIFSLKEIQNSLTSNNTRVHGKIKPFSRHFSETSFFQVKTYRSISPSTTACHCPHRNARSPLQSRHNGRIR
jgi:hypothetical protein